MRRSAVLSFTFVSLSVVNACADDPPAGESATESETDAEADTGESGTTPDMGSGETETETGDPVEPPELLLCGTEPPPGATLAPDLPTYAGPGTCPTLETGPSAINVMQTDHGDREFILITPSDYQAGEQLPVIVMYHWLGGDMVDFYERAETQYAVDYYRIIAIIPEGREGADGVPFRWPMSIADDDSLMDEEFAFHDDMLACVHAQFGIDKECVSAMGVSAGALFSGQLAGHHGDHLSSFISLSGGTGGGLIKPWVPPTNIMPAMVLWGGPDDFCIAIDFEQTSHDLEMGLEAGGHFTMECVHNCTHATPPFIHEDTTLPTYAPAWEFFLDHPYWLEDGESPYYDYVTATGGLPPAWPEWCAIGAGNATIRRGECGGSECQ
jgi:predicted esterase